MIWDPRLNISTANSPVVEALITQMMEVLGSCGEIDDTAYADVAFAVETALADQTETADAESMALLAARAMHGLGFAEAASRLYVLGGGIVRPTRWASAGDAAVWTLDMVRLARASDLSLEIGFRRTVMGVLDTIAYLWDETDGSGIFGLARLVPEAGARPRRKRDVRAQGDEIVQMCQLKLGKIATRRGWPHVPQVIRVEV